MGIFFGLYSHDGQTLDNRDLLDMVKELWWLLVQFNDDDDSTVWTTLTDFITQCMEQSQVVQGNAPPESSDAFAQQLADLSLTTPSLRQRMAQLDRLLGADAPACDLTLPSFRMVVLTNETLEMFFDHGFQNGFKFDKSSAVERQKSLGRELFENLFAEGKSLAKAPPAKLSTPKTQSAISSPAEKRNDEDMSEQVDHLFTELGHLDVQDNEEPYVLV